jgi:hypothetical protein
MGDSTDDDYGQIVQFASSAGEGGRMRFIAGGTETLNLRSGNVGIGTSSPAAQLSVVGSSLTNVSTTGIPAIRAQGGYGGGIGLLDTKEAGWYAQDSGDTLYQYVGRTVGSDTPASKVVVTYKSSGNVGIGTASPTTTLSVVNDSTNEGFNVRHSNNTAGIGIGYNTIQATGTNTNQGIYLMSKGAAHIIFHTNSTERMRIDSSGNVGIGTVTPLSKLHVEGNIGQQATTDKSVSSGVVDSGINIISGVHNTYARGSGRLRVMGTENNLNVGYAEYMYSYSRSSGGTYYINLKFIDEAFVNNTYSRPRLYLYNSSTYNNNSTNRQNTNQTANSTNTNIGQIGITNVADAYGTFQIVVEPMHWKQ